MIDKTAFHSLSYGLYIISTKDEDRSAGCVVNTFQQVTSSPMQVSVTLNKENATTGHILNSGRFVAACLSQEATMDLIGTFGFHCSNDRDKFEGFETTEDHEGVAYVREGVAARFSVRVVQTVDVGTHIMFIGEVDAAEKMTSDEPMTYAYYHLVKGGKTPPKASSFIGEVAPLETEKVSDDEGESKPVYAYRCSVCGHIEYVQDVSELPDDYACLVCGVGTDMFERIEV